MPNKHAGSVEHLLQRARASGLIDYYERRGDRIYIEAASLQIELNELQARHWLEAALDAFLRMRGGLQEDEGADPEAPRC